MKMAPKSLQDKRMNDMLDFSTDKRIYNVYEQCKCVFVLTRSFFLYVSKKLDKKFRFLFFEKQST